jgi:hypothetical protein
VKWVKVVFPFPLDAFKSTRSPFDSVQEFPQKLVESKFKLAKGSGTTFSNFNSISIDFVV